MLSKGRVIGLQSEGQAKANPEGPSEPGDFKCKGPLQEGCKERDLVITTNSSGFWVEKGRRGEARNRESSWEVVGRIQVRVASGLGLGQLCLK